VADVLCFAKRAADVDTDSELYCSYPENNPGTSDCVLSYLHEEGGVGATINHKKHLNTCANSSSAQTYYIAIDTHARGLNSECSKQSSYGHGQYCGFIIYGAKLSKWLEK
jgi:sulfur transfer complex TusBCD TusB component (DsrH family)